MAIDLNKYKLADNLSKYKLPTTSIPEKEPNYLSRVIQDYTKAGQDIISGIRGGAEQIERGEAVGGLRAGLRTIGGVAGAAFAPITEAPVIKPALEAVGAGIAKIPGLDILIQKLGAFAEKHPELAKDLQNIVDVSIVGVGAGAQRPIGAVLERTGVTLEKSGIASIDVAKKTFAKDLVKPLETGAVKLEQVGRTIESSGLFKKDIIQLTPLEIQSAKEVALIPGISPKNTFQKNFNLVRDYNVNQAKQLSSDIAKYDFNIPKKEIISRLDKAAISLQESPLIVGDAEKTANRLIEGAKKFINANEGKGSGVLKARKEYDSWVLSQKPKAFDAKAENAFTIANDEIRRTLNTILEENAVNLGVKDSLTRQFSLYRAMDTIGPKAALEANTPFLRVLDRIGKVLGVKSKIVQGIAAAVGIGGLGAAATFAPPVAFLGGIGFVVYKAGKLVMKPEVRIAVGKLLQTSGHLLAPADKKILQDALNAYKD